MVSPGTSLPEAYKLAKVKGTKLKRTAKPPGTEDDGEDVTGEEVTKDILHQARIGCPGVFGRVMADEAQKLKSMYS